MLTLIVLVPLFMGIDEATGTSSSTVSNATNVTSFTEEEREQLEAVRLFQVVATLTVIITVAIHCWHLRPFHRRHQNWLEIWLVGSSAVVITLAFVYTLLVARVGEEGALYLEIVLTVTLVVTTVSAAVYLILHYRREVARLSKQAAARASRRFSRASRAMSRRSTQLRESVFVRVSSADTGAFGKPPPPLDKPPPPSETPPPPFAKVSTAWLDEVSSKPDEKL